MGHEACCVHRSEAGDPPVLLGPLPAAVLLRGPAVHPAPGLHRHQRHHRGHGSGAPRVL